MPDKQIVTCITITKKQLIFPNSLLLLPEIVAHLPEFVALFPSLLVLSNQTSVSKSFQLLPPTRNHSRHNHGNMYTLIPVYLYSLIHGNI